MAKILPDEGLTFDDLLLVPNRSEVIPKDTDVAVQLTKRIRLNIPVLSSAMDTVTEHRLAIALAQMGGMGIIHKNLSIADQALEVEKVRLSRAATVPISSPTAFLASVRLTAKVARLSAAKFLISAR